MPEYVPVAASSGSLATARQPCEEAITIPTEATPDVTLYMNSVHTYTLGHFSIVLLSNLFCKTMLYPCAFISCAQVIL